MPGQPGAQCGLGEPLAAGWCAGDDRSVEECATQTREYRPHVISRYCISNSVVIAAV
jgi:hypothetical protein